MYGCPSFRLLLCHGRARLKAQQGSTRSTQWRRKSGSSSMNCLLDLPSALKVRIASFLSPRDAVRLSKTCKILYHDLALTQLPMKIGFKSWYDDQNDEHPRRGPKIPFLPNRTHSVTLTGSWSCRLGELQGRHCGANSHAQFYIVAYPLALDGVSRGSGERNEEGEDWLSGGRVVWASDSLFQRHYHASNSNSSWVKLTVTFVPSKDEEYYLCIQPGPGTAAQQQWWRHSLHLSNLVAHVTFHDDPNTNFRLKRQFRTIVKHMNQVENRGAYYTKILEAVARSIRIQLARFGRNALDPVLEVRRLSVDHCCFLASQLTFPCSPSFNPQELRGIQILS